jgi:hypothetical protein
VIIVAAHPQDVAEADQQAAKLKGGHVVTSRHMPKGELWVMDERVIADLAKGVIAWRERKPPMPEIA